MGSESHHESGCGSTCLWPFSGRCSRPSHEDESHVMKPPPSSYNQHAEQKKTSEKVAQHHLAVDGGQGEAQAGREHKASNNDEDGDNVDKEAEDFIGRMKAAMKAERLKSMKRFQSMLNRGT